MIKILLVFFLSVSSVLASEYTLKWGINHELSYFIDASSQFKKNVEKRTNNRVTVDVVVINEDPAGYPNLPEVQSNKFQMGQELVFELEKFVPEFGVWSLPFLFETDKQINNFINSPRAKSHLQKLTSKGVVPVDYTFSGGFIFFFGKKLNSLLDLQGLKIDFENGSRTYEDFVQKKFQTTAGGDSSDASEIIAAVGDELYEPAAKQTIHVNVTNHRVIARVLFISQTFLDSLPQDLRKIVLEEAAKVAVHERQLSIDGKIAFLKKATSKKLIVNDWSNKQRQSDKKLFQPLFDSYNKKFGPAAVSEIESLSK